MNIYAHVKINNTFQLLNIEDRYIPCADQINTLIIIPEQCKELSVEIYMIITDFMEAFDSVNRKHIWSAIEAMQIPRKIICLF